MRCSKDENAYILAEFASGDIVTIDVYRLSDDVKVVDQKFLQQAHLSIYLI